jgi:hypothetical protein
VKEGGGRRVIVFRSSGRLSAHLIVCLHLDLQPAIGIQLNFLDFISNAWPCAPPIFCYHDITEILLKVALSTINKPTLTFDRNVFWDFPYQTMDIVIPVI